MRFGLVSWYSILAMRFSKKHLILLVIIATAGASLLIDLPKIPVKFSYGPIEVDTAIGGYSLNILGVTRDLQVKKGLDLSGGVRLTFKADMTNVASAEQASALEGVRNVIERRINFYGVSEPNIQTSKVGSDSRVIVELPGITNTDEALGLVGKTAQLDFRELPADAKIETAEVSQFAKTDLSGKDLKKAGVTFSPDTNTPQISLEFTTEGAVKFAEITKRNVGRPLAIFLDENLLQAPTVNSEIIGGNAVITGKFDLREAKNVAITLNAGALPTPISLISQQQISATLGQESVQRGFYAGLLGLIIVAIFMVSSYSFLGFLAVVALLIYGLISLALYKLVPVTLSLAGLAGFLLSIGMAVDSNILIFERIKEERRSGRPLNLAMELGFQRAWDSIRDANACTLITCFVLFNPFNWSFLNSSGIVRGFALTLTLGILVSLFTGIVVTRTLVRLFYR